MPVHSTVIEEVAAAGANLSIDAGSVLIPLVGAIYQHGFATAGAGRSMTPSLQQGEGDRRLDAT